MSDAPLLAVRDLAVSFATEGGVLRAVDGISFEVPRGATVALVGESGCGKSVTAHALLRLLPTPPARIEAGIVHFEGRDLLQLPERELYRVRGGRVGMIFQEPMTSLNPVYTAGAQVAEAVRLHADVSRRAAWQKAVEALGQVGLPSPEQIAERYPHELSGGMRQRVMIAMATVNAPALVVADEPTTALDTTTQAQILDLFARLQQQTGTALLLISHDLALVAELADEVVVLYAGQVVERGSAARVLAAPAHPYTRALLRSVPPLGVARRERARDKRRLPTIEGSLPDLRTTPPGCRFEPRCPEHFARCAVERPPLYPVRAPDGDAPAAGTARCFLHDPEARPPARALELVPEPTP